MINFYFFPFKCNFHINCDRIGSRSVCALVALRQLVLFPLMASIALEPNRIWDADIQAWRCIRTPNNAASRVVRRLALPRDLVPLVPT